MFFTFLKAHSNNWFYRENFREFVNQNRWTKIYDDAYSIKYNIFQNKKLIREIIKFNKLSK